MDVTVHFPGALNYLSRSYNINDELLWIELLQNILQEKYQYLFSAATPHNFIVLYLNNIKIHTLNDLYLCPNDKLNILSAISGG